MQWDCKKEYYFWRFQGSGRHNEKGKKIFFHKFSFFYVWDCANWPKIKFYFYSKSSSKRNFFYSLIKKKLAKYFTLFLKYHD